MTPEFFQTEALRMERAMYRVNYAILRNEADCADAVQDALLRAWEKRDTLKQIKCFQMWMMRILINGCYIELRRRKRLVLCPTTETDNAPEYNSLEAFALMEIIEQLPSVQRSAITLYYMDGYSINDISDLMNTPTGTIKSRLKAGRDKLYIHIREDKQENIG